MVYDQIRINIFFCNCPLWPPGAMQGPPAVLFFFKILLSYFDAYFYLVKIILSPLHPYVTQGQNPPPWGVYKKWVLICHNILCRFIRIWGENPHNLSFPQGWKLNPQGQIRFYWVFLAGSGWMLDKFLLWSNCKFIGYNLTIQTIPLRVFHVEILSTSRHMLLYIISFLICNFP